MIRIWASIALQLVWGCAGTTVGAPPREGPATSDTTAEPAVAHRGDAVVAYHGQVVADPYRWLERDTEQTRRWTSDHDRRARQALAGLPGIAEYAAAIAAVASARRTFTPHTAGARRFFVTADGAVTELSIVVEHAGRDRTLVDGRTLAATGQRVHIRVWPSPGGDLLAYGVSTNGSRFMALRVLDVDRGEHLPDRITGLVAGRSSVSWLAGGRGLAYTRYDETDAPPAPLGPPRLVVRTLGGPERAVLAASDNGERITHWTRRAPGSQIVAARYDADGRASVVLLRDVLGEPTAVELAAAAPGSYWYAGELGGALVFSTTVGAERGHVRTVRPGGAATWATLIEQAGDPIDSWVGAGGMAAVVDRRVLVVYRRHADWVLRVHDERGRPTRTVTLPTGSSMWSGLVPDHAGRAAFLSLSGFADPGTVYRLDLERGALERWRGSELPYDPARYVTELVDYPRAGEDAAPMFMARRRDLAADGERPVLVYGYGWGGWSAAPWFRPHAQTFMDAGGVIALPIIRGGGERGRAWHLAGVRRNRGSAIADYLAACDWLARGPWSRAGRIIAEGQSAGGSLVATAVLKRPALFGAQILAFPVLDMLRYERFGGAAAWRSEFGTVDDAADFEVLRATSPVHGVTPGGCAPPTLLLPGEVDDTTPPFHAYKYAAALLHAQTCDAPVWLRIARGAGHAYGADTRATAQSLAAQIAFALHAVAE